MNSMPGSSIVRINAVSTAVFAVTATAATVVFDGPWTDLAVVVALAGFATGVIAFLWGYWTAVQRSRTDDIAVTSLYFLVDNCAPKPVMRAMNALLALQTIVAIVTASVRSSTDGEPGSTLAYGILFPMLGLGMNGLWGASHGTFRPRRDRGDDGVPDHDGASGQDVDHD
jgi:hypothetical protein